MSIFAHILAEQLTFSLPQTVVEKSLIEGDFSDKDLKHCIDAGLLSKGGNRISFAHEMYLDFFVANNYVLFSGVVEELEKELVSPKNHSRKELIIGALTNEAIKEYLLLTSDDAGLLLGCYRGEAGKFCKGVVKKIIKNVCEKVRIEAQGLIYEFADDEFFQIKLNADSLKEWTTHELAILSVLTQILDEPDFAEILFDIIEVTDIRLQEQRQILRGAKGERKVAINSESFRVTYGGFAAVKFGINSIFNILTSGFSILHSERYIDPKKIKSLLKKGTFKFGQIYFLVLICRNEKSASMLFSLIINILNNYWDGTPHLLKHEILDRIPLVPSNEHERLKIIEAVNSIHSKTKDIMISTAIFDTLEALGGLEEDTLTYEATVHSQVADILANPSDASANDEAVGLFNCQYDHPYSYAFYKVISELKDKDARQFHLMALKGKGSELFTSALIFKALQYLGRELCPILEKWLYTPLSDKHIPQESIGVSLWSHIILAKFNYPYVSKLILDTDDIEQGLLAWCEVHYWINRTDLPLNEKMRFTDRSLKFLLNQNSKISIGSLHQVRNQIHYYGRPTNINNSTVLNIEYEIPESIANIARNALENKGNQKSIYMHEKNTKVINYAISVLGDLGNSYDIKALHVLSIDQKMGKSAIEAIKKIESRDL